MLCPLFVGYTNAIDIISSNSGALFDLSLNDQDLVCILDIIDN